MKTKNFILLVIFSSIACTNFAAFAENKTVLIERANNAYKTFKKDIRCLFSKEKCTEEQKMRLIKQGVALATIIAVLTGMTVGAGIWLKRRSKKDEPTTPPIIIKPEVPPKKPKPKKIIEQPEPPIVAAIKYIDVEGFEDMMTNKKKFEEMIKKGKAQRTYNGKTLLLIALESLSSSWQEEDRKDAEQIVTHLLISGADPKEYFVYRKEEQRELPEEHFMTSVRELAKNLPNLTEKIREWLYHGETEQEFIKKMEILEKSRKEIETAKKSRKDKFLLEEALREEGPLFSRKKDPIVSNRP